MFYFPTGFGTVSEKLDRGLVDEVRESSERASRRTKKTQAGARERETHGQTDRRVKVL